MSAPAPIASIAPVRSNAFEPDRLLRVLAADAYDVHRLVYALCARSAERRFVFTPTPVAGTTHWVLVRSFDVQTRFSEGQVFDLHLRAVPTVKHAGRRRSIGAARDKDPLRRRWLHARARERGFELLAEPAMHVERVRLEQARTPFAFNACTYRAPVRVTEPAAFHRAYARGIGQGRAWGCGMVLLADPEPAQ